MHLVQSHSTLWQVALICCCRGIRAFEQNEYAEAVRLWSTALGLNEGDAAATLCNRSSAYTHQGLWIEALIDARQVTSSGLLLSMFTASIVCSVRQQQGDFWAVLIAS